MKENDFITHLSEVFEKNSLSGLLTSTAPEKMEKLYLRLIEQNKLYNLTSIVDRDGVILKHFADSLTCSRDIPAGAKVIDVGCGGGFPSLPLAICRDDITITSLDSTAKKVEYVRASADILGLHNLKTVCARAEDASKLYEMREKFDICVARAVADLRVLCELCLPFVKVGGTFIAMKSKRSGEELEAAETTIKRLGGKTVSDDEFEISDGETVLTRCNIIISKVSKTPSVFPRAYAQIVKKSL